MTVSPDENEWVRGCVFASVKSAEGAASVGPAVGAEDPATAQLGEKEQGGRMAAGSGLTWKQLTSSFNPRS